MPIFQENMPIPQITPDTRDFWQACREYRLVVQRCKQCNAFRFAPVPVCHNCNSFEFENVQSKGIGDVFTWTVTYRSVHPAADAALPFNIVVVRLADCGGAMITSNLLDTQPDEIVAGTQVQVVWDRINDEITLPRFRRITTSSPA